MTKISDLTALTGAGVDDAADLLPIVDMSEAGAARNKKITIDETRIALGLSSADSPQFTAVNLGHASDTTITRASAGVVAIEGVNIVTTAGGVTFDADIVVPAEAYGVGWNGSNEAPTKNDLYDKIETISAGSGIDIEDEGVSEATGATTLNFVGAGVTAADMGAGVVDVTIPGGGASALDDLSDVDTTGQTSGDVLTYDGAGWVPQAPSGGGDYTFIGRTVVTTLSAVDIALSDTYDSFHIEFYFTPSNDGIGLDAAVTDDNFSTVEAGATDYHYSRITHAASSTGVVSSNGTTIISILATASIGNAASEYSAGAIEIINAKETAPTHIRADLNYVTAAGAYGGARTLAGFKPTQSINGLRITTTAGTVTGFYKIWGRAV